jgi:hypothetical protein
VLLAQATRSTAYVQDQRAVTKYDCLAKLIDTLHHAHITTIWCWCAPARAPQCPLLHCSLACSVRKALLECASRSCWNSSHDPTRSQTRPAQQHRCTLATRQPQPTWAACPSGADEVQLMPKDRQHCWAPAALLLLLLRCPAEGQQAACARGEACLSSVASPANSISCRSWMG